MNTKDTRHIPQKHPAEMAIDAAVTLFAQRPLNETTAEAISEASGVSKRVIYLRFRNKRGLYAAAVAEAMRRLQPAPEEVTPRTSVPVEGMRQIVEAICDVVIAHNEAVSLLLRESTQRILSLDQIPPLRDRSQVFLQLDKLLIIGQDSGAFRPGIAAQDVYYLVISLLFHRIGGHDVCMNLFDIDTRTSANTVGVKRMAVDVVLSFLTANISSAGQRCYLESGSYIDHEEQVTAPSIYDEQD